MKAAPGTKSCRCTALAGLQSSRGRKGVPFPGIQFVKGNCTFCETIYPDLEISGCLSNTWIPWGSHTVLISIHGHLHGWGMRTVSWVSHLAFLSSEMRFPSTYKSFLIMTPIYQYLLCTRWYAVSFTLNLIWWSLQACKVSNIIPIFQMKN